MEEQYELEQLDLRGRIAVVQHEIWSHWMVYLFSVSVENKDGSVTIPKSYVQRWKRQMLMPYIELSQEEQNSDIEQADKVIDLLNKIG